MLNFRLFPIIIIINTNKTQLLSKYLLTQTGYVIQNCCLTGISVLQIVAKEATPIDRFRVENGVGVVETRIPAPSPDS